MFKILFTGLITCIYTFCCAQSLNNQTSAISKGLGNIRSISNASFAVNDNPAFLIQKVKKKSLGLAFSQMYYLPELNVAHLLFSSQNKSNGFGASLSKAGDYSFKKQSVKVSYAHGISNLSVGFRNTIEQIAIAENGVKYFFNLDLGCRYTLSDQLDASLLITNLTRSKIDNTSNFDPTYYFGLSYKASPSISFFGEFEKSDTQKSSVVFAGEYNIESQLYLRLGIKPKNLLWTTGIGFLLKETINIDIAYQLQETLGSVYSISFLYTI